MERLQKIIARAGICSRRAAEKLIVDGKVRVDGKLVTGLGFQAEWPGQDIEVDGKKLTAPEKHIYVIVNKPVGYISTASDDRGEKQYWIWFRLLKSEYIRWADWITIQRDFFS